MSHYVQESILMETPEGLSEFDEVHKKGCVPLYVLHNSMNLRPNDPRLFFYVVITTYIYFLSNLKRRIIYSWFCFFLIF